MPTYILLKGFVSLWNLDRTDSICDPRHRSWRHVRCLRAPSPKGLTSRRGNPSRSVLVAVMIGWRCTLYVGIRPTELSFPLRSISVLKVALRLLPSLMSDRNPFISSTLLAAISPFFTISNLVTRPAFLYQRTQSPPFTILGKNVGQYCLSHYWSE